MEQILAQHQGHKRYTAMLLLHRVLNICHQEAMCDEDMPGVFQYFTKEAMCEEELGGLDPKDPNRPRFTLQELRDVLHERNELKAKVFLLQEELAYYKSDEVEDEIATSSPSPSPELRTRSRSSAQPESGIKRLIFTAIMPMVAAGLIPDDPTLQPIRRLMSLV
ncbi:hypothetical protein AMECASPLE_024896 [Ameca splendens]|uniref:RH2 domain-containing protein n=1 Tax=Ameca splendens TaxID=208324 RepID=A0ABV0XTP1_9TELE